MAHKGFFKPLNPKKYAGNPSNIVYRSRWEFVFMRFCDKNSDVLEWSSEEFFVPYRCRTDGRIHRYFPDFKVKIITPKGIKTQVIEIKPYKEVYPPKKPPRMTKRYMTEALTYAKNKSKWEYAEEWCKNRGYEFKIITEKELGLKF
jgi:hypothetical protein